MNEYGNIYGSTIDPYAANFGNPMNSANMNSGFGIDPSLLTPSYQANYRPHFGLPSGYSPYGRPSFFGGVSNAFGPSRDPTWGNPHDSMQPSIQSMATKPFDAMAWAGQNVALPFAAYSGMAKVMGPLTSPNWSFGRAVSSAMAPTATGAAWKGAGIASRIGGGFGTGIARGLGMGALGTEMMGATYALASGLALPYMAGYAALQGANSLIFDTYANSRRNANNLYSNFSNVYFGGQGGDTVTGKGLGYRQSADLGNQINALGANDRMFSSSDYSNIFDMGSRSGLFDNVKSSGIIRRTKDIAEQIKLIVSISKDPDIQKAIEQLSSLNLSGASLTGGRSSVAAGAYQQMGGYAAQAGYSIQRLMSGVGAQGQYMFQANGMTPYLGQLAAGNALAGFSAAQRTGLLSSATLARSGGIEGAAQGSLTAQVMAAQTPYGMMSAYNRYIGGNGGSAVGGRGQSVVNTISTFGANVSQDPLTAIGGMALYGQAAAGADLSRQGSLGAENQAVSILREMHYAPRGAGGKYSPEQVAAIMTRHMGIPESNVRDYLLNRSSETDPEVYAQNRKALLGNAAEQSRQFINQNNLGGGFLDSTSRAIGTAYHGLMTNAGTLFSNPVNRAVGSAGDYLNNDSDWWGYGRSIAGGETGGKSVDQFNLSSGPMSRVGRRLGMVSGLGKPFNSTDLSERGMTSIMSSLNAAAKQGDADATALVSRTSSQADKRKALDNISRKNPGMLGDYSGTLRGDSDLAGMNESIASSNRRSLLDTINSQGRTTATTEIDTKYSKYIDTINDTYNSDEGRTSTAGVAELNLMGAAISIGEYQDSKGLNSDELLAQARKDKRFSGLVAAAGGDRATGESLGLVIDKQQRKSEGSRLYGMSVAMFNSGVTTEGKTEEQLRAEVNKVAKARNGNIYDPSGMTQSSAEHLSGKELKEALSNSKGVDKSLTDLNERYVAGDVTYAEMRNQLGKIDSSTTFAMGVDKFARNIDRMATILGKPADSGKPVGQASVPVSGGGNQNTTGILDTMWSNFKARKG